MLWGASEPSLIGSGHFRLEHHRPTSSEVGMPTAYAEGRFCRLEHQRPTSHEVGMLENKDAQPRLCLMSPRHQRLKGLIAR
jgi:hypothetical protein